MYRSYYLQRVSDGDPAQVVVYCVCNTTAAAHPRAAANSRQQQQPTTTFPAVPVCTHTPSQTPSFLPVNLSATADMAFTLGDVKLAIRRWPTIFLQNSKTIFHYGYIPTIIVLGMTTTEPKPSLLQILGPM